MKLFTQFAKALAGTLGVLFSISALVEWSILDLNENQKSHKVNFMDDQTLASDGSPDCTGDEIIDGGSGDGNPDA